MKKTDLKTGMIVELKNEQLYLVLLNGDKEERSLISFDGGWMDLNQYDENLNERDPAWSIEKVFSVGGSIAYILKRGRKVMENAKLLWERTDFVEMTISDIEKALNIQNLKIIKEIEL